MIDWNTVLRDSNVRCDCLDEEAEFLLSAASQHVKFELRASVFREITEKLPSASIWEYPIFYYLEDAKVLALDVPNPAIPVCTYFELLAEDGAQTVTVDDLI